MIAVAGAAEFLQSVIDPVRPAIDGSRVAVVVAHPDDETLGCGSLLARMPGVTVIVVTDGAPRNLADARSHGFNAAADYAAARARELDTALSLAGVAPDRLIRLDIADQEVANQLGPLSRRLADLLSWLSCGIILTHAYEGGHPDHDGTAFAVHAAGALMAVRGRPACLVEMPFYHHGPSGMVVQRFADPDGSEVEHVLTAPERAVKRRMITAYSTQQETLAPFSGEVERFRRASPRDFSELPNGGRLFYEVQSWSLTGARWRSLAGAALDELRLRDMAV